MTNVMRPEPLWWTLGKTRFESLVRDAMAQGIDEQEAREIVRILVGRHYLEQAVFNAP